MTPERALSSSRTPLTESEQDSASMHRPRLRRLQSHMLAADVALPETNSAGMPTTF